MSGHSSPSGGSLSNTSPRSKHSRQHRATVIVEQSLLSVKTPNSHSESQKHSLEDTTPQRKSTGSLTQSYDSTTRHPLSHRVSTGSPQLLLPGDRRGSPNSHQVSPDSFSHSWLSPSDRKYSTDSLLLDSPPDSVRSSVSSLVDTSSSISNLAIVTSTEDRLLEELKKQISQGATRIKQLEQQVETIPSLSAKVDDLEKERGKLANDLLDSQEIVQSMKQRLSLLHEQNNQLVKLTHSTSSGSSELLRNRNALVASLTQIKKLQERVDTIPSLKTQLRNLTDENTHLKRRETELSEHFPMELPKGVTRVSYKELSEENLKLRESNQKLTDEVKTASDRLSSMSATFDNLKKRMDKFESTRSIAVPLQQKIKRLEKEKDDLYQELIDVKFHQRPSVDIDTAHLMSEVSSLQKKNSTLHCKLEQVSIDSRQEKEKLVLKLFELESLNVNSQKYELERQLLEVEEVKARSTALNEPCQESTPTSNHGRKYRASVEDEMADLPMESKIQMLKLHQLKVHSEQSRTMVQNLLTERDELEKRVEELQFSSERKSIEELEKSVDEKDCKLQLARESIDKLEKELQLVCSSTSDNSSVLSENKQLLEEVERFKEVQKNYEEVLVTQKQARQCLEEHQTLLSSLQKAKDDKHKIERRYKEGKSRLRSLARELASSVELLKNFQSQCARLQQQVDESNEELQLVRCTSASYKAKLVVAEAESSSSENTTEQDGPDHIDQVELRASYEKVCKEKDDLQKTIDSLGQTISKQQSQLWTLKSEKKESETTSEAANKQVHSLTEENASLGKKLQEQSKKELEVSKECTQFQTECTQLTERARLLEEELHQAKEKVDSLTSAKSDLEIQLKRLKQETTVAEKQKSSSDGEKETLRQEIQASRDAHDTLQKQLLEKEKALQNEMSSKKQIESELLVLKNRTLNLNTQISTLTEEKEAISTEHKSKLAEVKRLEKSLSSKTEEFSVQVSREASKHSKLLSSSQEEAKSLREELEKSKSEFKALQINHKETERSLEELENTLTQQRKESEKLNHQLTLTGSSDTELQEVKQAKEKLQAEVKRLQLAAQNTHALKMELEVSASHRDSEHRKASSEQTKKMNELKKNVTLLTDEIEGYKATIRSLQRHVDEAETREVEHERLKQNFKKLEKALGHSSHDNKALFGILQQTLKELPSYSSEASRSLQDENLKLEEQVSVLSQWNDKQRHEVETLEQSLEKLEEEKQQLLVDIMSKESFSQENAQLKRELKEVEMEVNTLRRHARSDAQEELQVRVETQTQLLAVFNQHNTSLQKQVTDLNSQVQNLGGTLERDKPVSPPPMPDVALSIPHGDDLRQRTKSDLERENYILKERVETVQKELGKLQAVSSRFRRRSSSLHVMFSVPVAPINEELQVK